MDLRFAIINQSIKSSPKIKRIQPYFQISEVMQREDCGNSVLLFAPLGGAAISTTDL